MKKILIILLILSLLLSGCGSPANTPDTPTQEPVLNPTEETRIDIETDEALAPSEPTYNQQPMAAVSMPIVTDTLTADNGTVIAQLKHQNIHLFVQDQQIADMVIIDFLNRQDAHLSEAEQLKEQAKSVMSSCFSSAFLRNTPWA